MNKQDELLFQNEPYLYEDDECFEAYAMEKMFCRIKWEFDYLVFANQNDLSKILCY